MNHILRAWRASFVRRWHNNPDLCHTVDPDSGHQGRTALLVLLFEPDASRNLLAHAITHDQGEVMPGDMSHDAKKAMPDLAKQIAQLEAKERVAQGFCLPNLTEREKKILKLCDWLDAWLWMMKHERRLYARKDWQAQLRDMHDAALDLGVGDAFAALIHAETTR